MNSLEIFFSKKIDMISQLLCEETIGRARVEKGKIIEKSNSRGQNKSHGNLD